MKDFAPAIGRMLAACREGDLRDRRHARLRRLAAMRRRTWELLLFATGALAGLALCYQFDL
jgi:hypothetical protein